MMSNFLAELEKAEWSLESRKTKMLPNLISLVFFGLIPFATIFLGIHYPEQAAKIYLIGKLTMLICSAQPLLEIFTPSSWKNMDFKRLCITTTLLALAPISFLMLQSVWPINISGIEQHLQKFELQEHLIFFIIFLCLGNALLEETFFRGFLNHPSIGKSQLKMINAFLFMPHHLVITLVYFPWPLALLFTLATGVAGWAWMNQRLHGAKIPELWISHFILDLIVIGGAVMSFNLI